MNNSRTKAQVGSTTCAQEGFSRLEDCLSKLPLNAFAIYKYIDNKSMLIRQKSIHHKHKSITMPLCTENQINTGVSIVGQAAQLRKKITYTEECFKTQNNVDMLVTEIAFPIYWEGGFYGVLYVVSNNRTDLLQHQLYDLLAFQNFLQYVKLKPVNQLQLVSKHNQPDEQVKTAQKVFNKMLKKMHCQLEFDPLLDQFNELLQIELGANDFNSKLNLLVRIYLENEKMKVFGLVLNETFVNPVANNQMAVADNLFMAYSTYRRHLSHSKKMLYYDFLKNI